MRIEEFAEAKNVSVRTALTWVRRGIVPGAHKVNPDDKIPYWQIPHSSLNAFERPKSGPARGTPNPRKGQKQAPGKGRKAVKS